MLRPATKLGEKPPLVLTVKNFAYLDVPLRAKRDFDRMAVDESAGCRQLTGASLNKGASGFLDFSRHLLNLYANASEACLAGTVVRGRPSVFSEQNLYPVVRIVAQTTSKGHSIQALRTAFGEIVPMSNQSDKGAIWPVRVTRGYA